MPNAKVSINVVLLIVVELTFITPKERKFLSSRVVSNLTSTMIAELEASTASYQISQSDNTFHFHNVPKILLRLDLEGISSQNVSSTKDLYLFIVPRYTQPITFSLSILRVQVPLLNTSRFASLCKFLYVLVSGEIFKINYFCFCSEIY